MITGPALTRMMRKGCGLTGSSGWMMSTSGTLDRDVRKRKAADRRRRNGDNAEYLE